MGQTYNSSFKLLHFLELNGILLIIIPGQKMQTQSALVKRRMPGQPNCLGSQETRDLHEESYNH